MVGGMRILSRSLRHFKPKASIFPENSLTPRPNQWLYQTRRTLILESAPSQSVNLHRLSDSDSGIVEFSLERPQVRNAIGKDMLKGLQNTFDAISNDASANVLLLIRSKVPKVFCAGADLKERKMMSASEVRDFVNKLRATFTVLEVLPIPTIAVIEGAALGGGLEMALSCDLRICVTDQPLLITSFHRAGATQRLPRLVGKSVAKELILTGRKIGGREAMSMGISTCVLADAHVPWACEAFSRFHGQELVSTSALFCYFALNSLLH